MGILRYITTVDSYIIKVESKSDVSVKYTFLIQKKILEATE